jgi:FeS assembly SUF system regulator
MLKVGKLADYGLLIADCLAAAPDQLTTEAIVQQTGVPDATVRKLLRQLVDGGIVSSRRGLKGGYRLSREPDRISVAELIAAIEGPIGLTECTHEDDQCNLSPGCGMRANWHVITELINRQLATITLADMAGDLSRRGGGSRIAVMHVAG